MPNQDTQDQEAIQRGCFVSLGCLIPIGIGLCLTGWGLIIGIPLLLYALVFPIIEALKQPASPRKNTTKNYDKDDPKWYRDYERELEKEEKREEKEFERLSKIKFYQYDPELTLDTPLSVLEIAYKKIKPAEYEILKEQFPDREFGYWESFDGFDFEESSFKPPEGLAWLKKFRKIVEAGNVSEKDLVKSLKSAPQFITEEYGETDPQELAISWLSEKIAEQLNIGTSIAEKLYRHGYKTTASYQSINFDEISKIKGVGPKTLEQLKAAVSSYFQDKTS